MTRTPPNPSAPASAVDRRTLLRSGGLAVSLGALIAACGEDRGGLEEPGRVGTASPPDRLPDGPIDDVMFLRTAQSIEYTALEVYAIAGDTGALGASESAAVARFVKDHTAHAEALGQLITAEGGEPFTCSNPWFMERILVPVLAAVEGSDDAARDLLNIAHALETLAGATYQLFVGMLEAPELRRSALAIGTDETRHAALLAMLITGTPEGYISPALFGEEVVPDEAGFPIPYAISSRFGQLGAQELVVGARGDDGARFSTTVQTPAENSYVYDFMEC